LTMYWNHPKKNPSNGCSGIKEKGRMACECDPAFSVNPI
jgi:hypothetical protein